MKRKICLCILMIGLCSLGFSQVKVGVKLDFNALSLYNANHRPYSQRMFPGLGLGGDVAIPFSETVLLHNELIFTDFARSSRNLRHNSTTYYNNRTWGVAYSPYFELAIPTARSIKVNVGMGPQLTQWISARYGGRTVYTLENGEEESFPATRFSDNMTDCFSLGLQVGTGVSVKAGKGKIQVGIRYSVSYMQEWDNFFSPGTPDHYSQFKLGVTWFPRFGNDQKSGPEPIFIN